MTFATWLTHPTVQAVGEALLDFIWQGSLLALFLMLLKAATPSSAARFRYAAATLIMSAMLFCVVVTITQSLFREEMRGEAANRYAVNLSTRHSSPTLGQVDRYPRSSTGMPHKGIYGWAVCIWLAGVLVLSARTAAGWLAIRNLRSGAIPVHDELDGLLKRMKSRLGVSAPVRLCTSAMVRVPTVFGCIRPWILLPVTALTGLSEVQIESLVAHELAHISRHDYLINVIQTLVETVLFYHPAVWWVGAQMRREREHCCDDIAVAACGNAFQYASALAEMEILRGGNPTPALAASGGDLPARIRRLLSPHQAGVRRSVSIAGGTLMMFSILGFVGLSTFRGSAQRVADLPGFEVASVKLSRPAPGQGVIFGMISDPGRFRGSFVTLRDLVGKAYGVDPARISGGPSWVTTDRYDVVATLPPGALQEQIPIMLQKLLAERFGLTIRRDTKMSPVYALVPAKGGPKLKRSEPTSGPSSAGPPTIFSSGAPGIVSANGGGMRICCGRAKLAGVSMAALADLLSSQTDRAVQDDTGIQGLFDVSLEWSPEDARPQADGNAPPGGPSIYTAIQEQLGLRLEPRSAPSEYLVVERAERPAEN